MVKLLVDQKEIEVEEGTTLLRACLESGIYIPNLCYLEGMVTAPASCRLCFVEIEGKADPILSCTVPVSDAMVVKTDTPIVRRLQRSALQLLLSVHDVDCGHCPANKVCELQRMAKFLRVGLKPKRLDRYLKEPAIHDEHPFLNYYPNRCVHCGRCIHVCRQQHGKPHLTFAKRGFHTVISFYGETVPSKIPCKTHFPCVDVCPVSALTLKATDSHPLTHIKEG